MEENAKGFQPPINDDEHRYRDSRLRGNDQGGRWSVEEIATVAAHPRNDKGGGTDAVERVPSHADAGERGSPGGSPSHRRRPIADDYAEIQP